VAGRSEIGELKMASMIMSWRVLSGISPNNHLEKLRVKDNLNWYIKSNLSNITLRHSYFYHDRHHIVIVIIKHTYRERITQIVALEY
jgi:hypothetical protein